MCAHYDTRVCSVVTALCFLFDVCEGLDKMTWCKEQKVGKWNEKGNEMLNFTALHIFPNEARGTRNFTY